MTNLLIYGIAVVMFVIGLILFYKSISVLGKVETLKDEMCAAIGDWVGKFESVARGAVASHTAMLAITTEFKATVAKWNDQLGDFRILSQALIEFKQRQIDNLKELKDILELSKQANEILRHTNESTHEQYVLMYETLRENEAAINKTLDMQLELYNAFNAANVKKPRAKKE